jgi:cardiolipin synthase A/B
MTDQWSLHTETKEIWQLMMADMEKAQTSIEIEQYSFWDDKIGHRFLDLLEKKHRQGVQIRVICDGWGSYPLFQSTHVRKLIKQGMKIEQFNPVSLVKPSTWFYHLHKKTLIIDSKLAWTGGLGIKKKFRKFIDTMARLEGPIVSEILESFEITWSNVLQNNYYHSARLERRSEALEYLVNYCGYGKKEIYEQMRENIQKAEKSIYLTTSYFFPDRNFFQLILDKARAGVDVRIILRGKDDEFLPVRFSTSYFNKALRAGMGIYRYESAIIHAKTAIIDDRWATIGSSNLDKFSFYYNMESNIASHDPKFISEVKQLFLANIKECRKIELQDWEKRPLLDRAIEFATWPIHNYL